jgi:hypothetical protein
LAIHFFVVFHSGIHHVFQESSGIFLFLRERELKEKRRMFSSKFYLAGVVGWI